MRPEAPIAAPGAASAPQRKGRPKAAKDWFNMSTIFALAPVVELPPRPRKRKLHRLTARGFIRAEVRRTPLVKIIVEALEERHPDAIWPIDIERIVAAEVVISE
jgi:hypothetical protein